MTTTETTNQIKTKITLDSILKFTTLSSILISIFGYGVVIGLLNSMNMDIGIMIGSPFDLITLSWPGILIAISAIGDINIAAILKEAAKNAIIPTIALLLLCATYFFIDTHTENKHEFFSRAKNKIIRSLKDTHPITKSIAIAMCGFLAWIVIQLAAVLIALIITYFSIIIPTIGYSFGAQYFNKFIAAPQHCAPIKTSTQKEKSTNKPQDTAICVEINSTDDKRPYKNIGRSVLSTSSYILIYHPSEKTGERIPISTFSVKTSEIDEFKADPASPPINIEKQNANKAK